MVAFRKKFQPFVQQLIFFSIEYMYIYILYIYRYRYITYTMYIIYIYIYYITYMYIRSLKILINLEISKYFYPEEAFGRNQSRLKLCFTYQYIPCIFQVIYIYMYIYIYIYLHLSMYICIYLIQINVHANTVIYQHAAKIHQFQILNIAKSLLDIIYELCVIINLGNQQYKHPSINNHQLYAGTRTG